MSRPKKAPQTKSLTLIHASAWVSTMYGTNVSWSKGVGTIHVAGSGFEVGRAGQGSTSLVPVARCLDRVTFFFFFFPFTQVNGRLTRYVGAHPTTTGCTTGRSPYRERYTPPKASLCLDAGIAQAQNVWRLRWRSTATKLPEIVKSYFCLQRAAPLKQKFNLLVSVSGRRLHLIMHVAQ